MSEEVEMTPITPEEGGTPPPKVTPSATVASSAAPTVKLKPVIRKPMIRKPVIGGAKPVTLKPAVGTPPPPAAVPEAAAPAAEAKPAAAPQLKSITSPIAAQAILRKTGIVAEGILTPAQAQAAKTTTSRISLESAIGVAPAMKSSAPMKTIKLRRPTDIPPAPGEKPPAPPPPAAAPAPAADAAPEAATESSPSAVATEATTVAAAPKSTASVTVTQKKTLKLQRPGFKRPTVSGLRRPGATGGDTASGASTVQQQGAATGGDVADLSTVADIPDIKPMPSTIADVAENESGTVAGAPAWLNAMTLIAGIAALVVIGFCTWTLFREAVGPAAGPNDLASFQSDTDYRR